MEQLFNFYRIKCLPTVLVPAYQAKEQTKILTPEGEVIVEPGDWILKGAYLYKCKNELFCEMYEWVGQ